MNLWIFTIFCSSFFQLAICAEEGKYHQHVYSKLKIVIKSMYSKLKRVTDEKVSYGRFYLSFACMCTRTTNFQSMTRFWFSDLHESTIAVLSYNNNGSLTNRMQVLKLLTLSNFLCLTRPHRRTKFDVSKYTK
jgi:hypothetical protein